MDLVVNFTIGSLIEIVNDQSSALRLEKNWN